MKRSERSTSHHSSSSAGVVDSPDFDTLHVDAIEAAEAAGLRYVMDRNPGLTRRKRGKGFVYVAPDGSMVKDKKTLQRIANLRIPPAWQQVWICLSSEGHLQATGRDEKGRKQYIYHSDWCRKRDETKFSRMLQFAEMLPALRARIEEDLKEPGLTRAKVLATILSVMDRTLIRVGNEEYAKANKSYGLTTLRNRHVEVKGSTIRFHFRGKSGKEHDIQLEDPRVAKVVRRCQELPGQELFTYRSETGEFVPVGSGDVNEYIRDISGADFTAKDFRTWGGTVRAARCLLESGPCKNVRLRKSAISEALSRTAKRLGNTVAVCRKYYVHPAIFQSFETGLIFRIKCASTRARSRAYMGRDERLVLKLLKAAMGRNKTLRLHPDVA